VGSSPGKERSLRLCVVLGEDAREDGAFRKRALPESPEVGTSPATARTYWLTVQKA
jgi:hypothetical protein